MTKARELFINTYSYFYLEMVRLWGTSGFDAICKFWEEQIESAKNDDILEFSNEEKLESINTETTKVK